MCISLQKFPQVQVYLDFLSKLKKERKLELVEISEEICTSYEKKSKDCLKASRVLLKENLCENSIGEAYYAMYNILQSLYYMCGIKCENHTAASLLLDKVFNLDIEYKTFLEAKKDRIDSQYYITPKQSKPATKESAQTLISTANNFILKISEFKTKLKLSEIEEIRKKFQKL